MFFINEICPNKLALYSELMIFIRYKYNSYYFIYHIQENVVFYSGHVIFNEKFFLNALTLM